MIHRYEHSHAVVQQHVAFSILLSLRAVAKLPLTVCLAQAVLSRDACGRGMSSCSMAAKSFNRFPSGLDIYPALVTIAAQCCCTGVIFCKFRPFVEMEPLVLIDSIATGSR